MSSEKLTPAMSQYYEIKEQYKDCVLFFRMGDFYEMFDEDATTAGRVLGITVTSRNKNALNPTPLAGIPYHASDKYLAELTKRGYKVAIAEQVSDAKLPGIIRRKVVRVVTPGTTLQDEVLNKGNPNYLLAVVEDSNRFTIALCDLSTGEANVRSVDGLENTRSELFRLQPKELLLSKHLFSSEEIAQILTDLNTANYYFYAVQNDPYEVLKIQYGEHSIESMGIEKNIQAAEACAMVLSYLVDTQKTSLNHLRPFRVIQNTECMNLDEGTIRNLELLFTQREGKLEGSLLHLLNKTHTGAGSRLLRSWLLNPLLSKEKIVNRLQLVDELYSSTSLREDIRTHLKNMYDIERILAKLSLQRAHARDMVALKNSIYEIQEILSLLDLNKDKKISQIFKECNKEVLHELYTLIEKGIIAEPPLTLQEGGIIREGYRQEIDELRSLKNNATQWILDYQTQEQQKTGIATLRIKFTNVFGYFIELSKSQSSKAPEYYVRRQTTVNGERYTTEELKVYEDKILHADDALSQMEYECFQEIREKILQSLSDLQQYSEIIAYLDVLSSFAELSYTYRYVCPQFVENRDFTIIKGRHPVIEALEIKDGRAFIPNNTCFKEGKEETLLITGPNMAGKSTYLRQNALIALMAQIGCFVPAESAELSLVDKIFTRVGASDNVSKGQSTFMVEMQETAYILNNATKESLIILDEVGRGTSTYDGLSLAWAILEYIHDTVGAKTLFATHYHELIDVVEKLKKAKNYSVAVQETSTGVVFLRKIVHGGAPESYGIEVAKLAGLPKSIISKASAFLRELETSGQDTKKKKGNDRNQLSFFLESAPPATHVVEVQKAHPLIEEWKNLDINTMSPMDALHWLSEKQKDL
ncbi:MAG: DNA mismatch repair protein MutS [Candidatus Gracilibacteria bacterium]